MAEEDVAGGMAAEGGAGDSEGADEWVAQEDVEPPTLAGTDSLAHRIERGATAVDDEIPPEPPEPPPGRVMQPRTGDFPESLLTYYEGELPGDILAVWGVSRSSELSARIMIAGWGIERFRDSEVHQMAVKEQASDARMDPIRKAFVAAQKKKEEKKK